MAKKKAKKKAKKGVLEWLQSYSTEIYALLRIVAGLMFAFHGMQKILGILMPYPQPEIGTQIWFGGMIELIGGLLIAIGWQTRWAAFISSGTMAVAYFQFHWKFQMDKAFFPGINNGELAVLYCFVFLMIACYGAGTWSLDKNK